MAKFLASKYSSSAGDDELRQRYTQLQQWAAEDGILKQATKAEVPSKVKGAFSRLTEFFRREESAMVGVWEVLSGDKETPDETPGGRFVREMLGGTKLGNLIGVEDRREEKTYGDFLTEQGVPEGAKLSDVIGEDWQIIKYFDPSVRDTAALALSIFGTPSTYLTRGASTGVKWVGRAGEVVNVSEKGLAIGTKHYTKRLNRIAKELGIEQTDDLGKLQAEVGKKHAANKAQRQAITGASEEFSERLAGIRGRQFTEEVFREATVDAAEEIAAMSGREARKYSERFALRYFGVELPGSAKGLATLRTAAGDAYGAMLQSRWYTGGPFGEFLAKGGGAVYRGFDKIFQRIPRGARKYEAFRQIEMRRHASYQSAEQRAASLLFGNRAVFNKAFLGKFEKDEAFAKAFARYADLGVDARPPVGVADDAIARYQTRWEAARANYLKEAQRVGLDPEEAVGTVRRWNELADFLGVNGVSTGLLGKSSYDRFEGRYFPHQVTEEFFKSLGKASSGFVHTGADASQYALHRQHDTLEDLAQALAKRAKSERFKLNPEEAIDWNVPKVLHDYVTRHLRAQSQVEAVRETTLLTLDSFGREFRSMIGELKGMSKGVTPDQATRVQEIVAKGGPDTADYRFLRQTTPEARANYLYLSGEQLEKAEDFATFIQRNEELIERTGLQSFAKARDTMRKGRADLGDFVDYKFSGGPLKGKRAVVPRGIAEFWDSDDTRLIQRLPKEVQAIIKTFDLFQNTFKRSHTIIFPSFHVRNAYSNAAALAVETNILAMMSPTHTQRVVQLLLNGGKDWSFKSRSGRVYTRQQVRRLMEDLDIIPERMRVDELTGSGKTLVDRWKTVRKIDDEIGKKSQGVENYARASFFLNQLERGIDPATAAEGVKRVLFDYSDLSFTQREIVRRLFPFATWTMKNVELQARNLLTKPGRVGAVIKAVNTGERGPDADLLPEFMRGEMKVGLRSAPGKATFLTNIDLPINNVDILWSGGIGKTMREQFNMFTPILKAPLELMLNLDTFDGQSIRGRKWLGQMGPKIQESWPKWAQDWVELEEVTTADGRSLYKANGTKMYLLTKNIFLGRLVGETTNVMDMITSLGAGDAEAGGVKAMRALSGMRLTDLDIDEAQRARLRDRVRRIEQFLLERGSVADFTRTFRPKSRQQNESGFGIYQ